MLCRVLTSFVKVSSSCVPGHTSNEIKLSFALVGNDGMVILRDPTEISRRCWRLCFERLLSDQSYPAISVHTYLNRWVVSCALIQEKDGMRASLNSSTKLSGKCISKRDLNHRQKEGDSVELALRIKSRAGRRT